MTANFKKTSQTKPKNPQKKGSNKNRKLQGSSQSINWVDYGLVTPIRDQGQCGSCWAFAASAAIESAFLIYDPQSYTENTIHVSEQQQVDCVQTSYGCEGGWSEDSFEYSKKLGITAGSSYQYTGQTNNCRYNGGNFKIYDYEHYQMTCE